MVKSIMVMSISKRPIWIGHRNKLYFLSSSAWERIENESRILIEEEFQERIYFDFTISLFLSISQNMEVRNQNRSWTKKLFIFFSSVFTVSKCKSYNSHWPLLSRICWTSISYCQQLSVHIYRSECINRR